VTAASASASAAAAPPAELVVVVGTDHHPFDRLVAWVDRWLAGRGASAPSCLMQYGTSRPPTATPGRSVIGHAGLAAALSCAAVVVSHGGPATIMEARHAGRLPIVVPRRHFLGEHVDDHQLVFVRRLAADGLVRLCEHEEALLATLDEAHADPAAFAIESTRDAAEMLGAIRRTGQLIDGLAAAAAGSRRGARRRIARFAEEQRS
jgi:UDP-N-acetylglucosamine transferase subunit ALG13